MTVFSINQSQALSYAVEPRQKGRFAPYFWKPQSSSSAAQALVPLLFPEALPTITLLDRSLLLRGKKESMVNPEVDEAQIRQVTQYGPKPRLTATSSSTSQTHPDQRPRNLADTELEETLIRIFDGQLVLKIMPDVPMSRPTSIIDARPTLDVSDDRPSRGNSIRLSPAARLERKGSMARTSRRSSLPSISQRNSLLVPEPVVVEAPIRVVVKSGSLEQLVEILVSGLEGVQVTVADDNGEMPLRDRKVRTGKVDRAEFGRIWWSVFRSFVTPFVLFEVSTSLYLVILR